MKERKDEKKKEWKKKMIWQMKKNNMKDLRKKEMEMKN